MNTNVIEDFSDRELSVMRFALVRFVGAASQRADQAGQNLIDPDAGEKMRAFLKDADDAASALVKIRIELERRTKSVEELASNPVSLDDTPIYYMRDNHTFRKLPEDIEGAFRAVAEELEAGFTSGSVFTRRHDSEPACSLSFTSTIPESLEKVRAWLTIEITERQRLAPWRKT